MTTVRLLDELIGRADVAKTHVDLLEFALDELHDPRALEHAALAGVSLTHLSERLDELLADHKEAVA